MHISFTGVFVAYYPGANAQLIESQITTPLEDTISGIEGIDYVSSISRAESSQISILFTVNRDPDDAANDVRHRVASARNLLPREAEDPIVAKTESDAVPIMYMALSSDRHDEMELSDYADRVVKDRTQVLPGVAQLIIMGERRYSMRIWLDRARLAAYSLTPADVEAALRAQNVEVPSGRIESVDRPDIMSKILGAVCLNCRFWRPLVDTEDLGECRQQPPVLLSVLVPT